MSAFWRTMSDWGLRKYPPVSNVTAFPSSASRGASGAPGGSCRSTISSGRAGLLPPTAASAPRPASVASMISDRSRGTAAARSASPAGEITFAGASTSSRATFVQRATSAARAATGARSAPQPQITKRSTPGGGSPLRQRRPS